MSYIPSRLREAVFRRYEEHIKLALELWPTPIKIAVGKDLNVDTVAHAVRSAILSYRKFSWLSQILASEFHTHELSVSISEDNTILLGPKGSATKKIEKQKIEVQSGKIETTKQELYAICMLLDANIIVGPVRVQLLQPSCIQEIEDRYDVAVKNDSEGSTIF